MTNMKISEQLDSINTWCCVLLLFMLAGVILNPYISDTDKRVSVSNPLIAVAAYSNLGRSVFEIK